LHQIDGIFVLAAISLASVGLLCLPFYVKTKRTTFIEKVTLVTVGINEPYESNARAMKLAAPALGFYNVLAWAEIDFLADPLTRQHLSDFAALAGNKTESIFCRTWGKSCRPYCELSNRWLYCELLATQKHAIT